MKRAIAIAVAACLVAGAADAKRRHGHRTRNLVRKAVIIYVLTEDQCPKNPPEPTICYWRKAK
jgi:hypothetical protein